MGDSVRPSDDDTTDPGAEKEDTAPISVRDALSFEQATELRLRSLARNQDRVSRQVNELYMLLMGVDAEGKPTRLRGVGKAMHDMANHTEVIAQATDLLADQAKSLPVAVAKEIANTILASYQSELRVIQERLRAIETKERGT